jgi:pectinesterase
MKPETRPAMRRRRLGLLGSVVAMAATIAGVFVALDVTSAGATSSGYEIRSLQSNMCIEVPHATTTSGARLWQAECNLTMRQKYVTAASKYIYGRRVAQVKNLASGKCLGTKSLSNFAALVQLTCRSTDNRQFWLPVKQTDASGNVAFKFKNVFSGKCIDNQNSVDQDHYLILYTCYAPAGNQSWQLYH